MFKSTKIARLFGIDIYLHLSWWVIIGLLTWSLATTFFPFYFEGFTKIGYWLLAISSALLLFVSVLFHELSHSLVARARNIEVKNITLFFFGGVAGIEKEEMKPMSEFLMAIAGPLFSLVLAVIFYLIFTFNGNFFVTAITFYLYQLNFILAVFNLVPAYPLDGGRAFRAILYGYYKDLAKATKIASFGGKIFAWFLIILGIYGIFTGVGGGLWFVLIGGFLYFIAKTSYEQVVLGAVLRKVKVKDLLTKKYITLNPDMKFSDFIKKYYNYDENIFLVKGKGFVGLLALDKLGKIDYSIQKKMKLKQVSVPITNINKLNLNEDGYSAYKKFIKGDFVGLPVLEKSKLLGFVSRSSVMKHLMWSLKFGDSRRIKK
jgi:Zn-dependent protease